MDLTLYHYMNSLDFSRRARCPRCGQNSLSASDGFMVSCCMYCEDYHCTTQDESSNQDGFSKRLFCWIAGKCEALVKTVFQNKESNCLPMTKADSK